MTDTEESGRYVTPERIRADGEAMEAQHFILRYECSLLGLRAHDDEDDDEVTPHYGAWRGFESRARDVDRLVYESIPGEQGRMA